MGFRLQGFDIGASGVLEKFGTPRRGIWQSGRGLVGGADSSIYFETGNDGEFPSADSPLANSFVKLRASCQAPSLAAPNLSIAHAFTPKNSSVLSIGDTDLGSSGPILLPGGRVVGGGKEGRVYVLDQGDLTLRQDNSNADGTKGFQAFVNTYHSDHSNGACPGLDKQACIAGAAVPTDKPKFEDLDHGLTSTKNCYLAPICYQLFQTFGPNIHAGFVYMPSEDPNSGLLYALAEKEYLRGFRYHAVTGTLDEQPALTSEQVRAPEGMPGGAISISANGTRDGIIWVSVHKDDAMTEIRPGTLFALDANNFQLLWQDKIEAFAKFNPPTVADGKVFLGEFAALESISTAHPAGFGWLNVFGIADQPAPSEAKPYGAPRRKAYGNAYRKPY